MKTGCCSGFFTSHFRSSVCCLGCLTPLAFKCSHLVSAALLPGFDSLLHSASLALLGDVSAYFFPHKWVNGVSYKVFSNCYYRYHWLVPVFPKWKYSPFFSVILESLSTSMATLFTRTHMNLRLKHYCFQVAGTSHERRHDLINDFHSSVVTSGMEKITRLLYGWCGRGAGEKDYVSHWKKKRTSCNSLQISVSVLIQLLYSGDLLVVLACLIALSSPRRLQDPCLFP